MPCSAHNDKTASRPEVELMLHCARTRMDTPRAEQIRRIVRAGIDWDLLIETCRRHHVLPLLCWNLGNLCSAELPREIASALRAYTRATLGRNMALTGELFKILQRLQAHQISAVPFKGPALASAAYGNLAFRDFGDLDILVRRRDVPAAREVLLSAGLSPYRRLSERQDELHLRHESAFEFLGDNGLVVELHWELTSWRSLFPVDPESLWTRLEPVSVAGRTLYTLPARELLLYLCAHGAKHQWQRLQWVCDIAEYCQAREWPWTEILNRSASVGVKRLTLVGFSVAETLLELVPPPEIRRHIAADSVARTLAAHCRNRIVFQQENRQILSQHRFFWAVKERVRDKVRYLLGRAWANATWSDKDVAVLRLPAWLHFLYYLIKPVRVLGETAYRLWQIFTSLGARSAAPAGTTSCLPKD